MLGAIYALIGLSLVMVFTVTRIFFVPQGEFVIFGALMFAFLQDNKIPSLVWLTPILGVLVIALEVIYSPRGIKLRSLAYWGVGCVVIPLVAIFLLSMFATARADLALQIALTLLIIVPLGPLIYRLVFESVATKSVLLNLFVALAVHFCMLGLGLAAFGAEGWRGKVFIKSSLLLFEYELAGQVILVVATFVVLAIGLWYFFNNTISGKALRATAFNRNGAQLVGIKPHAVGRTAFALSALMGVVSGILIVPLTTIYYDSGFIIILKGAIGAVCGAMASYPLTAVGAIASGVFESFVSFYASSYKEALLFSVLIPLLMWRSFRQLGGGDD